MALSFTEKQHWRNHVGITIDGKIKELKSASKGIRSQLHAQADEEIQSELNLDADFSEYGVRAEEIADLQAEQKALLDSMAATVYGDDLPFRFTLDDIKDEIKSLVNNRADILFHQDPLGQHLDALEAEKERLLNAVLLAVNVQQIGKLMDEAAELTSLPKAEPEPVEVEDLVPLEPHLPLSDYSYQIQ